MANICTNYITIDGHSDIIKLVAEDYVGYDKDKDAVEFNFGLMSPIPDDIQDDYSWRINNWGNKWDGSDAYVEVDDYEIRISVDTAWGPCDKWILKLIELCPGVNVYHEYYEPGEGFIGWIRHNEDEDPEDYEDVFYNYSNDRFNYWLTVFEKEYECYEWLYERVEEVYDDEDITKEQAEEVKTMMDDEVPLEILISTCIGYDIL